jgi:drug/metabolite transporter (DMT)-like permease
MNSKKISALIALITGSLLLSAIAVLYKVSGSELSVSAIIFNRLWIATVALGVWGLLKKLFLDNPDQASTESVPLRQQLFAFLAAPISFLTYQLLWIYSVQETTVAISTVLHYLMPIYTAILAWIFFGEKFTQTYWISLGVVIAGILLLGGKDLQLSFKYIRADFIALLSGVFHAIYLIFSEELSKHLSTFSILFRICITGSLCSLVILLIRHEDLFPHSVKGWTAVISLGLGCQVLGLACIIYSLQYFSASFVSLFLLLEPVLGGVEAYFVLSERLSIIDITAFVIVLAGVALAMWDAFKSDSEETSDPEIGRLDVSNV